MIKIRKCIGRFAAAFLSFILLCGCADKGGSPLDKNVTGLDGYIGENIRNNIKNWQTVALENNPNIVDLIKQAGKGTLSAVIKGSLNGIKYSLSEQGGYLKQSLAFTQVSENAVFNDVEFMFGKDISSKTDWSGAGELWFYANINDFGTEPVPIRISCAPVTAATAAYIAKEGEDKWVRLETEESYVVLPAGFCGWVRIPLDTDAELKNVDVFKICIIGNNSAVGKTAYLDAFAVSGDVDGTDLPVKPEDGHSDDKFMQVWTLDELIISKIQYTGSLVSWYGEFAGKLLTGIAYNYALTKDKELLKAGNDLAAALKDAQGADGYLGVYTGSSRMGGNGTNWDVWGHYHCIYGLLKWYRITGNEDALRTAVKALDYVYGYFETGGRSFDSAGEQTMNLSICHAFALMYQETGDERYLNTAVKIVEEEWPKSGNWLNDLLDGKDYYETSLPRWEALHAVSALSVLYEITGNERYYNGIEAAWRSIVKTDRHNDGGFSTGECAVGTPYRTEAIETCCTVAWMALSTEYLRVSKNSYVADELELSFFNAMLGSLLEDDCYTTYNTPMDGQRVPSQETLAFQFNSGSPDFNCCQANLARGLGEVSNWAVLTDASSVYLNYYGSSAFETYAPSGRRVKIIQNTQYPKDGSVKITLSLDGKETFDMQLRIPFWSENTKVRVNGENVGNITAGKYLTISREWKTGDTVDIEFDMSLHYWKGENEQAGKTSVYCGPVLLALDTAYSGAADSVVFEAESMQDKLKITYGNGSDVWLFYDTVTSDGKKVRLVDFASAGKKDRSFYRSWLFVESDMHVITQESQGAVIWGNRP